MLMEDRQSTHVINGVGRRRQGIGIDGESRVVVGVCVCKCIQESRKHETHSNTQVQTGYKCGLQVPQVHP